MFADDIILLASSKKEVISMIIDIEAVLEKVGLELNLYKTLHVQRNGRNRD